MSRLLDSAARVEDNALSYPPYNIEQVGEHKYSITSESGIIPRSISENRPTVCQSNCLSRRLREWRPDPDLNRGTRLCGDSIDMDHVFYSWGEAHRDDGISAVELGRQLGVRYNTMWSPKHKLWQVMKERDETRPLGGWV